MNEANRELINRGERALNVLYNREKHKQIMQDPQPSFVPYVQQETIPIEEYAKSFSPKDITMMHNIYSQLNKDPHSSIDDLQRMIPGLKKDEISKYVYLVRNFHINDLIGPRDNHNVEIPSTWQIKLFDATNSIYMLPERISGWFDRLKNMIPSASTIFKNMKSLISNHGATAAKSLLGMALVAIGTYAAKKAYDYVFKDDDTIADVTLGLPIPEEVQQVMPEPEVIQERIEWASVNPTVQPDAPVDAPVDVIPEIDRAELKALEKLIEKPRNISVDHSQYIHDKIMRLLQQKIKNNRHWEPFRYEPY